MKEYSKRIKVRKMWPISPVEKVKPSEKGYDRKNKQELEDIINEALEEVGGNDTNVEEV